MQSTAEACSHWNYGTTASGAGGGAPSTSANASASANTSASANDLLSTTSPPGAFGSLFGQAGVAQDHQHGPSHAQHPHHLAGYGRGFGLGFGFGDTESSSHSSCGHQKQRLTDLQCGSHLVSFMAGSGLLYLPLALVEIQWKGILCLFAAALISIYTSKLLIECLDVVRWSNGSPVGYADLAYECYGKVGKYATLVVLNGFFLVSCVGYIGLSCALFAAVTGLKRSTTFLLLGSCVSFHVVVKNLRALALFSLINVALSFWIEAIIFGDAMYPLKQISLIDSNGTFVLTMPDLEHTSQSTKVAYSFALLLSGFSCHAVIPTFYNAMEEPRKTSWCVFRSQLVVLLAIYAPICIVTYAVYGDTLKAPVFFNLRNTFVRKVAIVLYCTHLLFSFTITIFPVQLALENFLLQVPCPNVLPSLQKAWDHPWRPRWAMGDRNNGHASGATSKPIHERMQDLANPQAQSVSSEIHSLMAADANEQDRGGPTANPKPSDPSSSSRLLGNRVLRFPDARHYYRPISDTGASSLTMVQSNSVMADSSWSGANNHWPFGLVPSQVEWVIKVLCRVVVLIMITCLAAICHPTTLDVFAYLLVPSLLVCLVLPSLFYLRLCNEEAGCLDKLANICVLLFAFWCLFGTLSVFV